LQETVPVAQVATIDEAPGSGLPARVQDALGELVGAAKEGLLALSVGVGLGVLTELMEEEVIDVVGPKGRHDPERSAVRHGHEGGEVTPGGRRVAVERPRVRTVDGGQEVPLETYRHFGDRDPLTRLVLEQMLAGVSTRRFGRTREPVGTDVEQAARSTSKSAVSREFVARTRENLDALMSRRLDDVRLA
jgi:putative transposase